MLVQFSFVGGERHPDVWVRMEAVPRVGETVGFPGVNEGETVVRTVVWYPLSQPKEPFVYVVLGRPRP